MAAPGPTASAMPYDPEALTAADLLFILSANQVYFLLQYLNTWNPIHRHL